MIHQPQWTLFSYPSTTHNSPFILNQHHDAHCDAIYTSSTTIEYWIWYTPSLKQRLFSIYSPTPTLSKTNKPVIQTDTVSLHRTFGILVRETRRFSRFKAQCLTVLFAKGTSPHMIHMAFRWSLFSTRCKCLKSFCLHNYHLLRDDTAGVHHCNREDIIILYMDCLLDNHHIKKHWSCTLCTLLYVFGIEPRSG